MRKFTVKQFKEGRIWLAYNYLLDGYTVRQIASEIGYSKTTIHIDLTKRLKNISIEAYEKAKRILKEHKHEGQVKGGHSASRLRCSKK